MPDDDTIYLTHATPTITTTGDGECLACGGAARWTAVVAHESLGTVHYISACEACDEVTEHTVDLLSGMVSPWNPDP
jgi:hypothetical protein